MVLACLLAAIWLSPANYANSLASANRQLEHARFPLTLAPQIEVELAKLAFEEVQHKFGARPEIAVGLAQCEMRLGNYKTAKRILESAPTGQKRDLVLSDVDRLLELTREIKTIDGPAEVLSIKQGKDNLFVLRGVLASAAVRNEYAMDAIYERVKLQVYSNSKPGPKKLSETVFNDGRRPANEHSIWLMDLDGDGTPEVIVFSGFLAGSVEPIRFAPFKVQKGKLQPMGTLRCDEGFTPKPNDLRGSWRATTKFALGVSLMSHAERPRWTDIYEPRGGKYVCVDQEHVNTFGSPYSYIRSELAKFPFDSELIAYSAEYRALFGKWDQAQALAVRASKAVELHHKSATPTTPEEVAEENKDYMLHLKMVTAMRDAYAHQRLALPMKVLSRGD